MTSLRRRRSGDIGATVWWRQLRVDAWADVMMLLVVATTVVVVAAAPRALEFASSRDLAAAIESATPEERNVTFVSRREIGAGAPSDPFFNVDAVGERLREEHVPASVADLFTDNQWVVDSPEFVVSSFPDEVTGPFPTTFTFRYQTGIEEHSTLVAGRTPEARDPIVRLEGPECPDNVDELDPDEFEPVVDVECGVVEIPLFETVISPQTAADMMLEVGDVVTLRPSLTDLSFRTVQVDAGAIRFALEIAGVAEFDDPTLDYWYGDTSLHRPRITENPDFRFVFATGLISPDQYRAFRDAAPGLTLNFAWRNLVDPDRIQDADAAEIRSDVAKITPPDVDVVTLLPELLGEHLAQRQLAQALSALAAFGVAVGALAAVWVLAAVDGVRRSAVTALFTDRGASRRHLRLHAGRTAIAVTLPAVLVGWIVAALWFRGTDPVATLVPVAAVAIAAAVGLVMAGMPPRRHLDGTVAEGRRIVAELVVVIVAVGCVVLLRRRATSISDVLERGIDPTLTIAPVAIGLLSAVFVMRIVGPLARWLVAAAGRTRGVGWFVGLRRLAEQAPAARAPVAVIALASTMAVFAIVVSMSLDRSRELASWQAVGGDIRAETGNPDIPLPPRVQDSLVERGETVSFGSTLAFQRFEGPDGDFVSDVVAVDLDELADVIPEGVIDDLVDVPLGPLSVGGDAIPAILVGERPANQPEPGDVADLETGAYVAQVEFIGASARFPGVSSARPAIVVDRGLLEAATDARTVEPTFAVSGDIVFDDELANLFDDPTVLVQWIERAELLDEIAGDPLSVWTNRFVVLLAAAALVVALITAGGATVISAADRRRDLGILTVIGLSRRDGTRLAGVELVPVMVLAAVVGSLAGAGVGWLIGDHLGLDTFADGNEAVIVVSWPAVAATAGVVLLAALVAVAVTVRSMGRVDHAMLLRKGDR